jgi:hypothetical protein
MLASHGFVVGEPDNRLINIRRAHVTMTYNVTTTSPKMAVNTTHLNDFLNSASMSFLALSNRSIRHLLLYGAGAGSLQFSKPQVPREKKGERTKRYRESFLLGEITALLSSPLRAD